MTDEQIEKALKCCTSNNCDYCNECPVDKKSKEDCNCGQVLAKAALGYIERLKTENANLTVALEVAETDKDNLARTLEECNEELTDIRKETAKEIKGHWEDDSTKHTTFKCSNCGGEPMYAPLGSSRKVIVTITDYCPHCGARLYWPNDEE